MLLVDVGTNAEIVLGNRDRVVAASSPTGPAFEGAEISAGQRAAPGAIERVRIDPDTLEPKLQGHRRRALVGRAGLRRERRRTTGVTGICGSAIIEVVAEMFLAGIISRGRRHRRRARRAERRASSQTGRTFSYSLRDGAAAAITRHAERRPRHPARQGGALCRRQAADGQAGHRRRSTGSASPAPSAPSSTRNTRWCSASSPIAISTRSRPSATPPAPARAWRSSTAATAARSRRRSRRIEKIETALEPHFQELFVNAMALPNKVDPFPNLAATVKLPARRDTDASGAPLEGRRRRGRAARSAAE